MKWFYFTFISILFFSCVVLITLIWQKYSAVSIEKEISNPVVFLTCIECELAPMDKKHRLPKTYEPNDLVVLKGYEKEERQLRQEAYAQLQKLLSAAAAARIDTFVISGYRSYEYQKSVFANWVKRERDAGYSEAEAVKRASTYSALPGHSEHQLGTAVDLMCAKCEPFVDSEGNEELYDFIANNAHLYGFVVSYPPATQQLTGYISEPWHIRFVGKEIATELFERGYLRASGDYLWGYLLGRWQIKP